MNRKGRVLCILPNYPQVSQTYLRTELNALAADYDLAVFILRPGQTAFADHQPFHVFTGEEGLAAAIRCFEPDVLHAHYLQGIDLIARMSTQCEIPFTIRSHSFDVIPPQVRLDLMAPILNSDLCLGVLVFPFLRPRLEAAGIRPEQIVECHPVVDVAAFYNPEPPRGWGVMNMGACIPKKRMEDFLNIAQLVPEKPFYLYNIDYFSERLRAINDKLGNLVQFQDEPLDPSQMAPVYRRHEWLLYTACPKQQSVGWPMAIAEAQAAGIGVCMANIRPDLKAYLDGAGFLYASYADAARIVRQPYPEEMRLRGYEVARRSDIRNHLHLLTDRWQPHLRPEGRVPWDPGLLDALAAGRRDLLSYRESLLETARALCRSERFLTAVRVIQLHLRRFPEDGAGWELLGKALLALKRFTPAQEAFARSVSLGPIQADSHLHYAQLLARKGEAESARSHLREALIQPPYLAKALDLLEGLAAPQPEPGTPPPADAHAGLPDGPLPEDAEALVRALRELPPGARLREAFARYLALVTPQPVPAARS